MAQTVKHPPASAGDLGSIPGLGRSPGEGNGNALQNSCLGNPRDRGACRSRADYSPWGRKESDTTEPLTLPLLVVKARVPTRAPRQHEACSEGSLEPQSCTSNRPLAPRPGRPGGTPTQPLQSGTPGLPLAQPSGPHPAVSLSHEMALRSTAAPVSTSQLTFRFPPSLNLFHQPDLSGPLSRYVCFLCAAPASSRVSLLHSPAPAFPSSHSQRGPGKTKMGSWTLPA